MNMHIQPINVFKGTTNPLDSYPKGMYTIDCTIDTPDYTNYTMIGLILQFTNDGVLLDYIINDACPMELHQKIGVYLAAQAKPLQEFIKLLKLKLIVDSVVRYDECDIKLKEV